MPQRHRLPVGSDPARRLAITSEALCIRLRDAAVLLQDQIRRSRDLVSASQALLVAIGTREPDPCDTTDADQQSSAPQANEASNGRDERFATLRQRFVELQRAHHVAARTRPSPHAMRVHAQQLRDFRRDLLRFRGC